MEGAECVNILLLGETGTGKSTLINALANYLDFSSFEEAENAPQLKCVIPAQFAIRTEQGEVETITLGADHNENADAGKSSTQAPRVHSLNYADRIIQIIDTPGINDSTGAVDKDQENFEAILLYLEQFKQLHAICFVLKPDTTVITAGFRYCLLELLSRLNCAAAENIVFVFTRTRAADYDAPECLQCLGLLVGEIQGSAGVKVPLRHRKSDARRNCFFLDNEGFQSFVALSQGHSLAREHRESWKVSNQAARDMIEYILADETRPHDVQDTLVVNKARKLIYELSHPLQDVNALVHRSLEELEKQRQELEQENTSAAQLRERLKIKLPMLNTVELQNPITVCTSESCTRVINGKTHYERICHDRCIHIIESINQIPLLCTLQLTWFCPAINLLGVCKVCSCHVFRHKTIYYETWIGEEVVDDFGRVKVDLSTHEGRIAAKRKALADLKTSHAKLKHEQEEIAKAMAKFACFVRANSICPINDAYENYLDRLIKNENTGAHSDKKLLERMRQEHIRYKEMFERGQSEAERRGISSVTPADVMETYESLKKLTHSGKVLAEMHRNVAKLRVKMRRNAPKKAKSKKELIGEIDSLIQVCDVEVSLAFINEFIQKVENGWGNVWVVKKSLGKLKTIKAAVFGSTVDAAAVQEFIDLGTIDLPTLWNKIKQEDDAGAMRKLYDTYIYLRKCSKPNVIDM